MTNRVAIVGSINVDSIMHIDRLPVPGETIQMYDFSKAAGGKGANQAVAAARAAASVSFIGAVGDDDNGRMMRAQLQADGVDVSGVKTAASQPTGQAYILLQPGGQNSIIIDQGANATVDVAAVQARHASIESADFTIAQLETPVAATVAAFELARAAGKRTILNPAPAKAVLPERLLRLTDVIVPNESESERLTGIAVDSPAALAQSATVYHQLGISVVVITLGSRGSYLAVAEHPGVLLPAFEVTPVDTTAAGDTFIGALAAQLQPDLGNLVEAARYASMAAAHTVQGLGALPSIPTRAVVETALAAVSD